MKNFLLFYRAWKLWKRLNISKEALSKEEKENLGGLYVHPQYKALLQLENNIIMDLLNKSLKEAQKEEEFLAVKWTRLCILLKQQQVKQSYDDVMQKSSQKKKALKIGDQPGVEEKFENLPDTIPLTP